MDRWAGGGAEGNPVTDAELAIIRAEVLKGVLVLIEAERAKYGPVDLVVAVELLDTLRAKVSP